MASFAERFAVARKALVGIFSDSSAREAFGLLAGIFPGAAGPPPSKGARERIAAYADMPWFHAVADKVASSFAAVDWVLKAVRPVGASRAIRVKAIQTAGLADRRRLLEKAGPSVLEITEHPILDLLHGGNSYMTGLAMRKITQLHLYAEGDAFWVKDRNALGKPAAIWPIPPHWIMWTPTPSRRTFRVSFRGWQGEIPDTEVIWFQDPNPENPYGRGTGMARALADELESDEYAAKFMRQVFLNQNRPDFIVYPKAPETWSDPERLRLQQDWRAQHEGFWRALRARFASREVGVFEFKESNFRSMQMEQIRRLERDIVVQVSGIPPEMLGILENSNRSTIESADLLFTRWVLGPRLESFRAILQERLIPEFDERLIIDYSSAVDEDREFMRYMAQAIPWSRTVDEWRDLQDLDALPNNAGQVFPIPVNVTFGQIDAGGGPVAALEGIDLTNIKTDELLAIRRLLGRTRRDHL